jgi:hypothetical protein
VLSSLVEADGEPMRGGVVRGSGHAGGLEDWRTGPSEHLST